MILGKIMIITGAAAIALAAAIWLYNEADDRRAGDFALGISREMSEMLAANRDNKLPAIAIGVGGSDINAGQNGVAGVILASPPDSATPATAPEEAGYAGSDGAMYIGVLSFPELSLDLPVNNAFSYSALKNTPCRYSGSLKSNDLVIASHSYKTHFGEIGNMSPGDPVIFTDVSGTVYNYVVAAIDIVRPSDAANVVFSQYDMTLFTCTYGGKARIVVRCVLDMVAHS